MAFESDIPHAEPGEVIGHSKVAPLVHEDPARTRFFSLPSTSIGRLSPITTPHDLDRLVHVMQSRITGGLSPGAFSLAFFDWTIHALNAPFQMMALGQMALVQAQRFARVAARTEKPLTPKPGDHRFAHPGWKKDPYQLLVQATLLSEEWWNTVLRAPPGVQKPSAAMIAFCTRQWLNLISPSNFPWLNPEVIETTVSSRGNNLILGMFNLLGDVITRQTGSSTASRFKLGVDLAATPGKVIYRNKLIELIQYAPSTPTVEYEPVLIIPAWIMKYYILDLSPHNSLIRWLVEQGRTVFCISWRNPDEDMRDMTFEDYRKFGVMAAINVVRSICGDAKIHAAGYCLGGTLLAIQAAVMTRDSDDRLASLTLLAAQADYSEAGELQLYISEDQLAFLSDMMEAQGYLSSEQMAGAFQMLRSNDLIWGPAIRKYLLGERGMSNDLMAWNADGTRMPASMHIEYLRTLFLNDDLAEGRFFVNGAPLAMADIRLPMFLVGTERDHIAPWRSVFKMHYLNDEDITFVLTSGGHNAGIVSEPGHPHHYYRIRARARESRTLGPDEWVSKTSPQEGSWWPEWSAWLNRHSSGPRVAPPPMGSRDLRPLCDAPGTYVFQK